MAFLRSRIFARQSLGLFLQPPTYAQHGRPAAHFKGIPRRILIPDYKTIPIALRVIVSGILFGFFISKSVSKVLYDHNAQHEGEYIGSAATTTGAAKSKNLIAGLSDSAIDNDEVKTKHSSINIQEQQIPGNSIHFA